MQLAAAAGLTLAVDPHGLLGEQPLDLAAAVHEPGELEELPEPDELAPDRAFLGHRANVARRVSAGLRTRCRGAALPCRHRSSSSWRRPPRRGARGARARARVSASRRRARRSEEHTSELQSRQYLV